MKHEAVQHLKFIEYLWRSLSFSGFRLFLDITLLSDVCILGISDRYKQTSQRPHTADYKLTLGLIKDAFTYSTKEVSVVVLHKPSLFE